jgi:hypothetical protein
MPKTKEQKRLEAQERKDARDALIKSKPHLTNAPREIIKEALRTHPKR